MYLSRESSETGAAPSPARGPGRGYRGRMPSGAPMFLPRVHDRRLLPGDARGSGDADFLARRPAQDADALDAFAVPGRRSSFAGALEPAGESASFSAARVERTLAMAEQRLGGSGSPATAPPAPTATASPAVGSSQASGFDPMSLLLGSPSMPAEPAAPAADNRRRLGLHRLAMRGVDRSDQGPRLGERPRRFVGDGLAALNSQPAAPRRGHEDIAASDVELTGMQAEAGAGSAPQDAMEAFVREQARIPMYANRPSIDGRDISESDAEHSLFKFRGSPESSFHPAPMRSGRSTAEDRYEVPGRRPSFLDDPSAPAPRQGPPAANPGPGAGRPMSSDSDDDFDPEWMHGKVPDSYYDSLGLPLGGHYLDTRRHRAWEQRAAARPKAQPKRRWWQRLGSFLRGRGWR